jgi:hypothetical protein
MVGGRLLLSWSAAAEIGPEIAALHDPVTGKLVTTGPTLRGPVNAVFTDQAGKLGVVSSVASASEAASAGWDLETGRILWSQEADEKGLLAISLVHGVVYGNTARGGLSGGVEDEYLAVELATKKVLQTDLKLASAPVGVAGDRGVIVYGDNLYVFGPA